MTRDATPTPAPPPSPPAAAAGGVPDLAALLRLAEGVLLPLAATGGFVVGANDVTLAEALHTFGGAAAVRWAAYLAAAANAGPGLCRRLGEAEAEVARLRARVADLEAALRPFAEYAAELDQARVPDLAVCLGTIPPAPTARDHRRAAAALAGKEESRG